VSILAELRERRLVQITLSYAGAGWILLEAVNQTVERGILPELVYRVVLIWFLLGLPAALLIGWHHGEKGRQKAPLSEWFVLACLALVALGFSGSTVSSHFTAEQLSASAENTLDLRRVAVTYFEDESGGEQQFLADALTEDLIAELSQVSILSVVSSNGTGQYRNSGLAPDSVGKLLQAGTVVDGSVDVRRENIRIAINLIDAQSGATIQRTSIERPATTRWPEAACGGGDVPAAPHVDRQRGTAPGERSCHDEPAGVAAGAARREAAQGRRGAAAPAGRAGARDAFQQADEQLLAEAQQLDESWAEPPTIRAVIAYRLARLESGDPTRALARIASGWPAPRRRCAAIARTRARWRCVARCPTCSGSSAWSTMPGCRRRSSKRHAMTWRLAVRYERNLATAHATLSHLYGVVESLPESIMAASRALEADAFLENADAVLWRLYNGAEALQQFADARKWCQQGWERFPDDYRFTNCSMRVMYLPGRRRTCRRRGACSPGWTASCRRRCAISSMCVVNSSSPLSSGAPVCRTAPAPCCAGPVPGSRRSSTRIRSCCRSGPMLRFSLGTRTRAVDLLARCGGLGPEFFGRRGQGGWFFRDLETHPRYRRLVGLD
jgi:TolB-like protein